MAVGKTVAVFFLFRLLLPLCLFGATIVRFNGFSLCYGILLLVGPLLPRPSPITMKSHTSRYLISMIFLCSMMLLAQIIFQGYLLGVASKDHPYGTVLGNCTVLESTLRQLGLQRLEPNDFGNILRIIIPDIGMFIISLIVFLLCRKLCPHPTHTEVLLQRKTSLVRARLYQHTTSFINFMGEFLVVLFLAASGIASPSVLSAVYFVTFLAIATWWACYNRLGSKFRVIRVMLLVYCAAHLLLEYLYQFQFFQEALAPNSLIARVLGINGIVWTDCRKPWLLQFNQNAKWYMYASPGIIFLLYYVLACETRRIFQQPKELAYEVPTSPKKRYRDGVPGEEQVDDGDEPEDTEKALVTDSQQSQNYQSLSDSSSLAPQGYGGVGAALDDDEDEIDDRDTLTQEMTIQMKTSSLLHSNQGQRGPLISVFVYVMQQSYVATLIIMMAWSITYHSWLTFVYLLSACIIWMIPQKRRICLIVSPIIVLYAEVLLAIQYVFGLNLNESELPGESDSGYIKYHDIGLIKILFTLAFWLTLRQYMRERYIKKSEYYMQGLKLQNVESGPQSATVGPASTRPEGINRQATYEDLVDGYDGENIKALGRWVWHMCLKYWIFVCAVMFLVMAVQEAVIYRIIYMVLFLYFVISFQLCYRWWRVSIYVFWWIVIVYSMILLCLIYTFQFDQVETFWKNGTGISEELLSSIGLRHYSTGNLFAQLLTPTSFLIVIILQVHYFQRPFNILSDVYRYLYGEAQGGAVEYHDEDEQQEGDSPDGGGRETVDIEDRTEGAEQQPQDEASGEDVCAQRSSTTARTTGTAATGKQSWTDRAVSTFKKGYCIANNILNRFSEVIWRLAEIHIFKAVAFTIFLVCLKQVHAISVLFIIFLMMGIPVSPLRLVMSHLCQVWSAIIILCKMIYQLQLLPEDKALSNCSSVMNVPRNMTLPPPFNGTINSAHYIGFHKTDNLAFYLKDYIIITLLLAFEAIIKIHQEQHYKPPSREKPMNGIVFPDIKREDADKNLLKCLQFMVNYTFYKFGLEICFTMTMVTMVVRLDAYSVIYGTFLGILLLLPRRKCYYVWPVYIMILVIFLTLQYLACLGVPPGLCWDYPWDYITALTTNLKIYLYLPDFQDPPDPMKLLADFFQLLFVCLQMRVFYLENSDQADRFGGGSNETVLLQKHEITDSRNGPHDFLSCKDLLDVYLTAIVAYLNSYVSYLDYIKTGIFLYMYWVTLIIVFIAGTTRISLFCMGYLVGCFFFLWFGQELLVKPLKNLVRLWGFLLGYNFVVILTKACLQLVGCVYLPAMSKHFCWVVQLFSIVCLRAGNYEQEGIPKQGCNLDEDEAGLTWDAICFVFLLLQLRIYKSHYFKHVVVELEIQNKLSARGAELINGNLIRRVEVQTTREADTLNLIKKKMERIKLRQERIHAKSVMDASDHYVVIRSGDYYMFDDDSDIEDSESIDQLDQLDRDEPDETSSLDDEKTAKMDPFQPHFRKKLNSVKRRTKKRKPFQRAAQMVMILNTAFKEGTKEALNVAEKQEMQRKSKLSESSDSDAVSKRDSGTRYSMTDDYPTSPTGPKTPTTPKSPTTSKDESDSATARPLSDLVAIKEDDDRDRIEILSDEEIEKACEEEAKDGVCTKVGNNAMLAYKIFSSFLDYMIGVLQDISREYRSVSRILDREKEAEKNRMREMHEKAEDQPTEEEVVVIEDEEDPGTASGEVAAITEGAERKTHKRTKTPTEIVLEIDDTERENFEKNIEDMRQAEKEFHSKMPRILQLLIALFEALMSRSQVVCYFAMILNHMISASLLSLAFPLSVFLWAMLSVPRPTKTYWVTVITYTEAIIVVKYLFQFGFFPWNDGTYNDHPFWPPRIIGIEKKSNYAIFDLVLLFCLFIHRTVLKRHGLWKDADKMEKDMAEAERVVSRPSSPIHNMDVPAISFTSSTEVDLELAAANNHSDQDTTDHGDKKRKKKKKKKDKKSPSYLTACFKPLMDFYRQMTNPRYNAVTDVYSKMFMCDFIAFLIIVFGYTSFGPANTTGAQTVSAVIQDNKVPVPFLVMLLAQFVLIIIDRALFLRKNVFGKFLFQILLVILIHVWMFFVLPAVTNRNFSHNTAAQLWYFVKCIYFGLSAYQIRSGYPTRILGNFLTKKENYLNLFSFKVFLAIPFLLELRALMDWMWTDTTLAITSWLQMEDIFANIFMLKCWRRAEADYPTPRGVKRKAVPKYGVGGLLLILLIFIIWFPLLLFSLANTVYQANPPSACTLDIRLGGYQPLFRMSAHQNSLSPMTIYNYSRLLDLYKKDPYATSFLNSYRAEDVYIATITGESTSVWGISPPSKDELYDTLMGNTSINMVVTMSFSRQPKNGGVISENINEKFIKILSNTDRQDRIIRQKFAKMINGTASGHAIIPSLFPKYIRVPASGNLIPVKSLGTIGEVHNTNANVSFTLQETFPSEEWWELREQTLSEPYNPKSGLVNRKYITIMSFNDRVAPGAFSFFTSYGIIGLYLSFILVIGRFIRMMSSGLAQNIMFTHLPYVDRMFKVCKDLYLVREAGELILEEELFAKLVFLYRSPETLIKVTRFPQIKEKQE